MPFLSLLLSFSNSPSPITIPGKETMASSPTSTLRRAQLCNLNEVSIKILYSTESISWLSCSHNNHWTSIILLGRRVSLVTSKAKEGYNHCLQAFLTLELPPTLSMLHPLWEFPVLHPMCLAFWQHCLTTKVIQHNVVSITNPSNYPPRLTVINCPHHNLQPLPCWKRKKTCLHEQVFFISFWKLKFDATYVLSFMGDIIGNSGDNYGNYMIISIGKSG